MVREGENGHWEAINNIQYNLSLWASYFFSAKIVWSWVCAASYRAQGAFNLPSTSPDSILYPICLNIDFTCLALVSIWIWDSYPHDRDAMLLLSGVLIYINWHAWIINQADCLFALPSLCPLLDTASQPFTRVGI